jgi:hypothetical protein
MNPNSPLPQHRCDRSKHLIKQFSNVSLVTPPVIVIHHQGIEIFVPAEFLNFSHIPVCCVQCRRDSGVSDAVRGHLLFDTSIFAMTGNNLGDTVAD